MLCGCPKLDNLNANLTLQMKVLVSMDELLDGRSGIGTLQ